MLWFRSSSNNCPAYPQQEQKSSARWYVTKEMAAFINSLRTKEPVDNFFLTYLRILDDFFHFYLFYLYSPIKTTGTEFCLFKSDPLRYCSCRVAELDQDSVTQHYLAFAPMYRYIFLLLLKFPS